MWVSTGGSIFPLFLGVSWEKIWGPRGSNNFGRMGYAKRLLLYTNEARGSVFFGWSMMYTV